MKDIAILTGATGGLGNAFVRELLKENVDEIWSLGRNQAKLDALVDTYGEKIVPIKCDLTNEAELKTVLSLLAENKPNVRFLINNAGLAKMEKITRFSDEEIAKTIEINCKVPALLCQYVIPYMDRGAMILNISSASSFQPNPYISLYSATKVFLRSYSRSMNYELKEKGITCTAVCPGWVDTEMLKPRQNGKKVKFIGMVSPDRVVKQALKDAKKGKDMSVCSLFVKYEHLCSKIYPQKWIMRVWGKSVEKYVKE